MLSMSILVFVSIISVLNSFTVLAETPEKDSLAENVIYHGNSNLNDVHSVVMLLFNLHNINNVQFRNLSFFLLFSKYSNHT